MVSNTIFIYMHFYIWFKYFTGIRRNWVLDLRLPFSSDCRIVDMVIRLPTGSPKHSSLNPYTKNKVFSIPNRTERLWASPSLLFSGYQKCFLRHEADRSTLSIDEVQIKWSRNSTPPYPLRRSSTGKDLS